MWVHQPPPNSSSLYPPLKAALLLKNCSNHRFIQICKSRKAVFTQGCALLTVLICWAWLSMERIPSVSSQPLVDESEHRNSQAFVPALSPRSPGEHKENGQVRWSFPHVSMRACLPPLPRTPVALSPIPWVSDVFWKGSLLTSGSSLLHCRNFPSACWSLSHPLKASSNTTYSRKPSLTTSGPLARINTSTYGIP